MEGQWGWRGSGGGSVGGLGWQWWWVWVGQLGGVVVGCVGGGST